MPEVTTKIGAKPELATPHIVQRGESPKPEGEPDVFADRSGEPVFETGELLVRMDGLTFYRETAGGRVYNVVVRDGYSFSRSAVYAYDAFGRMIGIVSEQPMFEKKFYPFIEAWLRHAMAEHAQAAEYHFEFAEFDQRDQSEGSERG